MELEEFIKTLKKFNKEIKQNKEKFKVSCNLDYNPITKEEVDPEFTYMMRTIIDGVRIIGNVIIEKEG